MCREAELASAFDTGAAARVAAAFGEAAVDPSAWRPALKALATATRSMDGQLIILGGPAIVPANLSEVPFTETELLSVDGYSPSVNYRVAAASRAKTMQTVWERDYDRAQANLRSDAYNEFVHKWDIRLGCQVTLLQDSRMLVGLALHRSEQDGATTEADRALFGAVAPHVRAAVRTQLALGNREAKLLSAGLETTEAAAFICDAVGNVVSLTRQAEALIRAGDVFSMPRGRLRIVGADQARLDAALARALRYDVSDLGDPQQVLVFPRPGGATVVQIDAMPALEPRLTFSPRVLIVVRTASQRAPTTALLRRAFGFSQSEAAIALDLYAGRSREDIAAARGAALGTVRQQVKAILHKASVNREADLLIALRRLV